MSAPNYRMIAAVQAGRVLSPNEIVHHRDEDHGNNSPENLLIVTRGEHSRLHRLGQTHTEETKKKISKTLKGRKLSMEERKRLSQAKKEYWAKIPREERLRRTKSWIDSMLAGRGRKRKS